MSTLTDTTTAILAVNAGSSSLKFTVHPVHGHSVHRACLTGLIEGLEAGGTPNVKLSGVPNQAASVMATGTGSPHERALTLLQATLAQHAAHVRLIAVAHRIVHGGAKYNRAVILDDEATQYLEGLSSLAPLHQPHNLAGVRAFTRNFPDVPQVACFDTAFHATVPEVEYRFALPESLFVQGLRRYGFHGLSYQYVSDYLCTNSARACGNTVIAHLGNGASACAVKGGKSVATTMGFSALDGLMMGTRTGTIDPGVLLHLLRAGWTWEQLEKTLYKESGLRGVSGLSADMRTLKASQESAAKRAVTMFAHRLVRECGALTACLQGLDVLAFTGGIGEHDSALRQTVCDALAYLGVMIDPVANQAAIGDEAHAVHSAQSRVEIWVVPTDEGLVAARDALQLLQ